MVMKMLKFDESYNLREVPDKVKEHYLSMMALGSDVPHVHDLVNDIMCLVGFGENFVAIIYLLRSYYGMERLTNENLGYYQNIIQENFSIVGSGVSIGSQCNTILSDGIWINPKLVD